MNHSYYIPMYEKSICIARRAAVFLQFLINVFIQSPIITSSTASLDLETSEASLLRPLKSMKL